MWCTPPVHRGVWLMPKTRNVGWSLNYIREEHETASLETLHELLGSSTGNCRHRSVGRGTAWVGGDPNWCNSTGGIGWTSPKRC